MRGYMVILIIAICGIAKPGSIKPLKGIYEKSDQIVGQIIRNEDGDIDGVKIGLGRVKREVQANGDLGIGGIMKALKSGNSNDATVSREKGQSHPVIYRGLGSCNVDIPNVGRNKLYINVIFSEEVYGFTPLEPFPPLYIMNIIKVKYSRLHPSYRVVQLSNMKRMTEAPGCSITFKYNYDFYQKPAISCTVETSSKLAL